MAVKLDIHLVRTKPNEYSIKYFDGTNFYDSFPSTWHNTKYTGSFISHERLNNAKHNLVLSLKSFSNPIGSRVIVHWEIIGAQNPNLIGRTISTKDMTFYEAVAVKKDLYNLTVMLKPKTWYGILIWE